MDKRYWQAKYCRVNFFCSLKNYSGWEYHSGIPGDAAVCGSGFPSGYHIVEDTAEEHPVANVGC